MPHDQPRHSATAHVGKHIVPEQRWAQGLQTPVLRRVSGPPAQRSSGVLGALQSLVRIWAQQGTDEDPEWRG